MASSFLKAHEHRTGDAEIDKVTMSMSDELGIEILLQQNENGEWRGLNMCPYPHGTWMNSDWVWHTTYADAVRGAIGIIRQGMLDYRRKALAVIE
jgi:hypothetical protein